MRGRVSRMILSGLLAGCMVVTPIGAVYAEPMPAEAAVEITVEESAETEETSESIASETEAEAPGETPEAAEPEETLETTEMENVEESEEAAAAEAAEAVSPEAGYSDPVKDFVARLYEYILQRRPDGDGLNAWTDVLKSGREQGAKVAQGFIESPEFQSRRMDDTTYLTILYKTFLNRDPDAAGLKAWQAVLDSGLSRMHVFRGFAESKEFTEICQRYGIQRGYAILNAPMDQNEGVTKFVVRCYRLCLGREADEDGLNAWCNALLTGQNTAKEVAHGFIFSEEYGAIDTHHSNYLELLYELLLGRKSDPEGYRSWNSQLTNAIPHLYVFNEFADSEEFQKICDSYGVISGCGTFVGRDALDIGEYYVRNFELLPGMLGLSACEDVIFQGLGTAYQSDWFYITYIPEEGAFSMANDGDYNIAFFGSYILEHFATVNNRMLKNGWEYIDCMKDDSGYYMLYYYAKMIDGKACVAQLQIDSRDYLRGWYMDNWMIETIASLGELEQ